MHETEEILAATRAIRPHLKELVDAEAEVVDEQLDKLLESAQEIGVQIFDLLEKYPNAQAWMQQYLEPATSERKDVYKVSYTEPLGKVIQLPRGTKVYRCPEKDCEFICCLLYTSPSPRDS